MKCNTLRMLTLAAMPLCAAAPALGAYVDVVLADSPTGYYRLGENSGTTATNIGLGGSGDATYSTNTTQGQPGIVGGAGNTAVLFSGSGTNADKSGSVYLEPTTTGATDVYTAGNQTFTLEAWFKTTSDITGDPGAIVSLYRTDANNRFHFIGLNSSEQAIILSRDTSMTSDAGSATLNDGNWHHLVGVFTATTDTLYVDGNSVASMTGTTVSSGVQNLVIGRVNDDNDNEAPGHFNGVIDEVAIYNGVALSEERIQAHYNAGIVPEPATLGLLGMAGVAMLGRRRRA